MPHAGDVELSQLRVGTAEQLEVVARILRPWLLAHPGERVVTVEDGSALTERVELHDRGRRACRRAGIDGVNFHQLRHTAASHLATKVPLPIVGAVLGHASPQTTARYAHLDTGGLARDPRLHLSFAAPEGAVVAFQRADGPSMDQAPPKKKRPPKGPTISAAGA